MTGMLVFACGLRDFNGLRLVRCTQPRSARLAIGSRVKLRRVRPPNSADRRPRSQTCAGQASAQGKLRGQARGHRFLRAGFQSGQRAGAVGQGHRFRQRTPFCQARSERAGKRVAGAYGVHRAHAHCRHSKTILRRKAQRGLRAAGYEKLGNLPFGEFVPPHLDLSPQIADGPTKYLLRFECVDNDSVQCHPAPRKI